ncbi:MAG: GPP34 family phosphoprotein [Micropruina sp.]|nr:MAG: GPP34 family phosphoprotein [Micropruina sp.]
MLLVEDTLLLATTEIEGKNIAGGWLDYILAGALLIDLTFAGNVRITEKGEEGVRANRAVVVPDTPRPDDPLLAEALDVVARKPKWSTVNLVDRLARGLKKKVYPRLVAAELVQRSERHVLGFTLVRYPAVDGSHERELLDAIDQVLLLGGEADAHTAALIGLLSGGDLLVKVVDRGRGIDRRAVKKRGKQLCEQHWAAKAAREAIQQMAAAAAAGAH